MLVCLSCNALLRAPSANCLFGGESHDSFGRRTEAGLDLDLMEQKKYLSTSRIRVRLRLSISHGNPGFGSTIANLQSNFFVLLTQSSNLRYMSAHGCASRFGSQVQERCHLGGHGAVRRRLALRERCRRAQIEVPVQCSQRRQMAPPGLNLALTVWPYTLCQETLILEVDDKQRRSLLRSGSCTLE